MLGAEPCDDFRDYTGVHSLHNSHAKQSSLQAVQFVQSSLRLLQFVLNLPRVRQQRFARGRQLYAAADSIEQLQIELIFQLPNLMRKGWLCHMQLCRRASKMRGICHREKVPQMPQFDLIEVHNRYLSIR